MNAMKHQHAATHPTHPAIFKDAFGGAKIGHVNGVNVIGLTLQGPSVPGLAVLKPPSIMQQGDFINVPALNSLQPRQPTTGNVDLLLPLQPKLLVPLAMDRRDSNRNPVETTFGMSSASGGGGEPVPVQVSSEDAVQLPPEPPHKVTLHNDSSHSTSFNDGHDTPSGDEV